MLLDYLYHPHLAYSRLLFHYLESSPFKEHLLELEEPPNLYPPCMIYLTLNDLRDLIAKFAILQELEYD